MNIEARLANPVCDHLRAIEVILGMPVVTVALAESASEIAFVFPGEADSAYVQNALRVVGDACQDASKTL